MQRHAATKQSIARKEELLAEADGLLRRQRAEKKVMEEGARLCTRMPWMTLERKLKAAEKHQTAAEETYTKASQVLRKAREDVEAIKKDMAFCKKNAQHLSSWMDWATGRHKRHDFWTARTETNIKKLLAEIEKKKASIPKEVWEELKRKERDAHESDLQKAQRVALGVDSNSSSSSQRSERFLW